jgi:predicted RNA polymerase sigma factor
MATDTIAPAFTTGEGATEETVQQKKNRIDKAASPYHGGIGIPEDGEA